MSFRFRPQAETDILEIARRIAMDSPAAARRWLDKVDERCTRLGEMPGMGATRFEIQSNLRISSIGSYLISYEQVGRDAETVRIVHGARQWQDLL